jgi:excinuclease ABC subunit C
VRGLRGPPHAGAQYRRFNIEGITGGDDYAAMRQVLTRRYARLAARRCGRGRRCRAGRRQRGLARMPDLVLVDGGAARSAMAREVFEDWGWTCR